MTIVAILCVFAGMFLGMRFKIFAILPATAAATLAATAVTAVQGGSLFSTLAAAILGIIGVQIGYLCGSFIPFVKEVPETVPAATSPTEHHPTEAGQFNRQLLLRD